VGGHRHAAARPARRRGRLAAAGFTALFLVLVCGVVAWATGAGRGGRPVDSRPAFAEDSPMSALHGSERDSVPVACDTLSASVADKLAPGADRNAPVARRSDQDSECDWGLYAADRGRRLSVELRAVAGGGGRSATAAATSTFTGEWRSDRAGTDLTDGTKVRDSRAVSGVGEQAYVVYSVDTPDGIGAAVANVRLANVLITVHYSGGDDRQAGGKPLSSGTATDGALLAARDIVSKLESHS
jgi:hypothetical protein